mgnify:CR=1 FL=1
MECQDYLSFSQETDQTLRRPPPAVCYNAFIRDYPRTCKHFRCFCLHTLHFIKIISIFVKLFQKKDEIKSLKAKRI